MSQSDSMDTRDPRTPSSPAQESAGSHWWVWVLLALIVAGGIWYYRGHSATEAGSKSAAGPGGASAAGNFVVPVVVATTTKGDLPVFFNGLGNVTAFNTVTVRSRVDGQIVKVNFVEGQYVKEGEALIEIDPRPYQVQQEQAEGQLAGAWACAWWISATSFMRRTPTAWSSLRNSSRSPSSSPCHKINCRR